jgi:transposase
MSISERRHVSGGAAPARRAEIFTGEGRRRSWNAREKSAIVAESYEEGVRACHVARRHGLTPQQLFAWRGEARRQAEARIDAPPFVPSIVETANTAASPNFDAANNAAIARPHSIELDIEGSILARGGCGDGGGDHRLGQPDSRGPTRKRPARGSTGADVHPPFLQDSLRPDRLASVLFAFFLGFLERIPFSRSHIRHS